MKNDIRTLKNSKILACMPLGDLFRSCFLKSWFTPIFFLQKIGYIEIALKGKLND